MIHEVAWHAGSWGEPFAPPLSSPIHSLRLAAASARRPISRATPRDRVDLQINVLGLVSTELMQARLRFTALRLAEAPQYRACEARRSHAS